MLGRQHALAGTAAWLAAAPALHQTPGQVALGAIVAAGAGMVPDLDQHGSTIGRTYGPITNVIARLVAFVARGHRWGTHCLLGLAAITGLAYLAVDRGGPLRFVLLWVLLGVACRAYGMRGPWPIYAALMGVITLGVLAAGIDLTTMLTVCVFIGCASHLVGDMLTPEGVPWFYPLSRRRYSIPILSTDAKSWRCKATTVILGLAVAALIVLT